MNYPDRESTLTRNAWLDVLQKNCIIEVNPKSGKFPLCPNEREELGVWQNVNSDEGTCTRIRICKKLAEDKAKAAIDKCEKDFKDNYVMKVGDDCSPKRRSEAEAPQSCGSHMGGGKSCRCEYTPKTKRFTCVLKEGVEWSAMTDVKEEWCNRPDKAQPPPPPSPCSQSEHHEKRCSTQITEGKCSDYGRKTVSKKQYECESVNGNAALKPCVEITAKDTRRWPYAFRPFYQSSCKIEYQEGNEDKECSDYNGRRAIRVKGTETTEYIIGPKEKHMRGMVCGVAPGKAAYQQYENVFDDDDGIVYDELTYTGDSRNYWRGVMIGGFCGVFAIVCIVLVFCTGVGIASCGCQVYNQRKALHKDAHVYVEASDESDSL